MQGRPGGFWNPTGGKPVDCSSPDKNGTCSPFLEPHWWNLIVQAEPPTPNLDLTLKLSGSHELIQSPCLGDQQIPS
jgi:hypothetical protein